MNSTVVQTTVMLELRVSIESEHVRSYRLSAMSYILVMILDAFGPVTVSKIIALNVSLLTSFK